MKYLIILFFLLGGVYLINKPFFASVFLLLGIFCLLKNKNKQTLLLSLIALMIGCSFYNLGKLDLFNYFPYGVVVSSHNNYFIVKVGFTSYFVAYENNPYEVFDLIYLSGTSKNYAFLHYESQFNFNTYLQNKGIYLSIDYQEIKTLFPSFFRIKNIINNYLNNLSSTSSMILGKLLFNVSTSSSYTSLISSNQLYYLLSVSSLHVYFFISIISKLLHIKLKDQSVDLILLIILLIIYIFSNYKISILKVLLYWLISYLSSYHLKKSLSYLDKISLVFITIIMIYPAFPYETSFKYTFILPFYLYFTRCALSSISSKYQKYYRAFILFLFLIPLLLLDNGYLNPLSFIIILILTPIIEILYLCGIISLFIPLYPLINLLCKTIYNLISLTTYINFQVYLGQFNYGYVVIYYLLLFVYFYFVENKHHRYQYLSLGIITSFLLISSLPLGNHFIYQVSYIDVGQGDASLIQYRNTNILIDTGGIKNNDIANDTLIPFLKKKRIYHLDYVFLTHNDYDHVGAFDTLKANYRVDDYNKDNNFTSITISNLTFYNLNPSSSNEENDDSLVLYFTIKNKTFLYLGDVSSSKEKEIVTNYPNLAISYLKVAHHGSKYSAYEGLISSYQVKNAIISCGVNNYYSHPSSEMLTLLNKYQVTIYRTDLNGTISFKI